MISLACVAAGLLMLSDVALVAVPLLALEASRNPMIVAPGQVSATSQSFAAARHTAPAFPGGCWHAMLAPSQVSAVQGSPSSGQAAPALPAGCVHVALVPLHTSAVQGLPSSVQGVLLAWKRLVGQVVLVPLQGSGVQGLPSSAQAAPALPAGCVHVALVPLHTSVVQGLPSSVQGVPPAWKRLVGQVVLVPVQFSATSHPLTAARQT